MHHWFNFVLVLVVVLTALALFFTVGYDMGSRKHSWKPVPPEPETKPAPKVPYCVKVLLNAGGGYHERFFHKAGGARVNGDGTLLILHPTEERPISVFRKWLCVDNADERECPGCQSQGSKP